MRAAWVYIGDEVGLCTVYLRVYVRNYVRTYVRTYVRKYYVRTFTPPHHPHTTHPHHTPRALTTPTQKHICTYLSYNRGLHAPGWTLHTPQRDRQDNLRKQGSDDDT